jgi:hypothetical protein
MPEPYEARLTLFTLAEAHQLLDVLQHYFAAEPAARVPSRDDAQRPTPACSAETRRDSSGRHLTRLRGPPPRPAIHNGI